MPESTPYKPSHEFVAASAKAFGMTTYEVMKCIGLQTLPFEILGTIAWESERSARIPILSSNGTLDSRIRQLLCDTVGIREESSEDFISAFKEELMSLSKTSEIAANWGSFIEIEGQAIILVSSKEESTL